MLTEDDWKSIYRAIEEAQRPSEIVYAIVTRRDEKLRLVWCDEFGDIPIPMVGFKANITAFDIVPYNHITDPDLDVESTVEKKVFQIEYAVPALGDRIAVIHQFGRKRLPKCIGVFLSIDNYNPEDA